MFRTGESIPPNVIGNVLNELLGYKISFYSLKDDNLVRTSFLTLLKETS